MLDFFFFFLYALVCYFILPNKARFLTQKKIMVMFGKKIGENGIPELASVFHLEDVRNKKLSPQVQTMCYFFIINGKGIVLSLSKDFFLLKVPMTLSESRSSMEKRGVDFSKKFGLILILISSGRKKEDLKGLGQKLSRSYGVFLKSFDGVYINLQATFILPMKCIVAMEREKVKETCLKMQLIGPELLDTNQIHE